MILRLASLALCLGPMPSMAQTASQPPVPPVSQALQINAGDPNSVVLALQELGFRAMLTQDDQGDPKIRSAASGVSFSVYFYGCKDDNTGCRDLLLYTIFDYADGFTARAINDWNEDKVMGAAFLDDENDPGIQHFMPGVFDTSLESFERTMLRWETLLDDFKGFIDW